MKEKPASNSAFFNPRVLLACVLCSAGVLLGMFSLAARPLSELESSPSRKSVETTRTNTSVPPDSANFLSTVGSNANRLPLSPGTQFSVNGQGDPSSSSPTAGFPGVAGMPLRPGTANGASSLGNPVFAGPSWHEVDVGTPTLFDAMAYDEATGQLVLFAGDAYNVTWIWNGLGWTKLNPPTRPGQRLGARMAYDPNTQTVIMFGGNDLTIGLLNETWSWNGTTWTQLHPAHAPSARFAPGLVYDVAENKLVLFGGEGANGVTQEDTWTWDGADWTQQITDVGPSPRFWPAMAYDPDTSSVVLFGGQSGVPGPVINDTWTWTAAGWSLQPTVTSPPGRGLTDMAYSPISHRVVLFGGINLLVGPTSTIDGLTWEWDGTNWSSQQISPWPGATLLQQFGSRPGERKAGVTRRQ